MHKEFIPSLLGVGDLWYRPVHLLPLILTTIIDHLLILRTQRVIDFFRNLEFEVYGDVGTGTRHLNRIGGRVVLVRRHIGLLLFLPPGDDSIPKAGIPGVSAIGLGRGKLSLLVLSKPQV
jgi:hypothetical protein